MVAGRLRDLGVGLPLIGAELDAMHEVHVGRTINRSVVGVMVDFARALPFHLPVNGWDSTTLRHAESLLAETPCRVTRGTGKVIFPERQAPELLAEKWSQ